MEFHQRHVALTLTPDFENRTVEVSERLEIEALVDGVRDIRLDSDGPIIRAVRDRSGLTLKFGLEPALKPTQLVIHLRQRLAHGAKAEFTIVYRVAPRGGFVFYPADIHQPDHATASWTSGEPDTNHLWLPIDDRPDDKLSAEFRVRVPAGYWVIANGRLDGHDTLQDGREEFHWTQEQPISPYLLAVYASHWRRVQASSASPDTVPIEYDGRPDEGDEEVVAEFGRTPAMLTYFTSVVGVPYPWAKYADVANPGFFSGLENASATEMEGDYPRNAHLADEHFDAPEKDSEVSHELSHQWFGDLVTCRNWSDLWLNEGFATFMAFVWEEHARGRDVTIADLEDNATGYLRYEDQVDRPIVTSDYASAWDLFDPVTYNKGGWAIRTLRAQLGDDVFWNVVREYLTRFKYGNATTADFASVAESVSGRSLKPFFQQWFYSPGHPVFAASWKWDGNNAVVHLDQEQADVAPAVSEHSSATRPVSQRNDISTGPVSRRDNISTRPVSRRDEISTGPVSRRDNIRKPSTSVLGEALFNRVPEGRHSSARPSFVLVSDHPNSAPRPFAPSAPLPGAAQRTGTSAQPGTLYTGTITIAAWVHGQRTAHTFEIKRSHEIFTLPLPSEPELVQVDPDHEWLKQLKWQKPVEEWFYEAEHAPWTVDRETAIQQLQLLHAPSDRLTQLLTQMLQADGGMTPAADQSQKAEGATAKGDAAVADAEEQKREAAARLADFAIARLAGIGAGNLESILLARLEHERPESRASAARLLGTRPATEESRAALRTVFENDPITRVRVAAFRSLLRQDGSNAWKYMDAALKSKSFEWRLESAALRALAGRTIDAQHGAEALKILQAWAAPDVAVFARISALEALGSTRATPQTLKLLRAGLESPSAFIQQASAFSLANIGDRQSLPAIEHLRDTEWVGLFRSTFAAAAQQLSVAPK